MSWRKVLHILRPIKPPESVDLQLTNSELEETKNRTDQKDRRHRLVIERADKLLQEYQQEEAFLRRRR